MESKTFSAIEIVKACAKNIRRRNDAILAAQAEERKARAVLAALEKIEIEVSSSA